MTGPADEHRRYAPSRLGFASITVSDSRSAETDDSGRLVETLVAASPHHWTRSELVVDEPHEVREAIEDLLRDSAVDVVVVSGGTGLSPRDVTIGAVAPMVDRTIPGFGELFRLLSFEEVGAAAMLSRAMAGLIGDKAVFLLPGSPAAVELAMKRLILPEAAHLIGQARRGRQ